MKKKLKIATVFSGIGAIEHALERLKIPTDIVFACDSDKFCKQTYFANFKIKENNWINLVQDVDGKKYKGQVDLFVGGSPCQSFSMVGKRKGLSDERGNLFFDFTRLITEIQPKIFIFENVKGLLSHDSGKTWVFLQKELDKLGYHISWKVLNARHYGIPQNRERLFVIGFKEKQEFKFPEPVELSITMQDLLEDTPDEKFFLPEKGIKFVSSEKNLKKRYTQINGEVALCQRKNQQFNWHGDFIDMEKYYLSDKIKKYVLASGTKGFYSKAKTDLSVARPLLSTMAKMHRAGVDNYITRGKSLRKLTPRECLRLMGFSDKYKIVVSNTQAYKQAGNSIVVDVLVAILKEIYNVKK
ncbi:MAG: DNA cytosine methyltransferase [Alphaproteobacteria bacterium]